MAPSDAKEGWWPSIRVSKKDSASVRYPITAKDVELFECSSDNPDVRVSFASDEKGKGVRVGLRSGGKKATAKVQWSIIDVTGLKHSGWADVVFEQPQEAMHAEPGAAADGGGM